VVIGVGMGGLLTPSMSTIARWFIKRRSVMAGIVIAGGGIGGIILPPLANWLISAYGWRDAYIIIGILILVVIVAGAQFLKRDPAEMGQEPYGGSKAGEQRLDLATEGLTLMEAVYTRQFWMSVGLLFCFGFCIMTVMLHIVPHATDIGISAAVAANVLAALGGSAPIGGIVIGGIADRMVNRQGYIICFVLMTAAMLWLLTAGEAWMLYLFAVVMGLGSGGAIALMSPLAAELFGIRSHGVIFGALLLWQTIGSAIGSFLAGHIFDITGSYQVAFLICAALGVIGLVLSATLRPIKKPDIGTQNF
jgi:MFS family permease